MMLQRRRKRKEKTRKRRKFWVRQIFEKREMHREHYHFLPDLLSGDREFYFRYLRMNPEQFEHILSLVKDKISKEITKLEQVCTQGKIIDNIFCYKDINVSSFFDIFVSLSVFYF